MTLAKCGTALGNGAMVDADWNVNAQVAGSGRRAYMTLWGREALHLRVLSGLREPSSYAVSGCSPLIPSTSVGGAAAG